MFEGKQTELLIVLSKHPYLISTSYFPWCIVYCIY